MHPDSRQYPSLQGRNALVRDAVEARYQALLDKHAHRLSDSRSRTHLQVACLVLATHRTLQPLLRDDEVRHPLADPQLLLCACHSAARCMRSEHP